MVPASNIIQNFESERRLFDPLVAVFVLGCIGVGVAAMPMWSPIGEINLYCFSYLSTAIIVWTLTYLVADIVGENLLRGGDIHQAKLDHANGFGTGFDPDADWYFCVVF